MPGQGNFMPKQLRRILLLTFALALGLSWHATAAPAQKRAHLEAVSVHLFLRGSGALTEDITKMADFYSWNAEPSGTGLPEREMFDSAVIKLRFHADREVFAEGTQATVRLQDEENRRRVRTETIRDVYIPAEGTGYRFIFLKDVGCKPMIVTVTGDGKPHRLTLPFRCGE